MRIVKFVLLAVAVIVVSIIGFIYLAPETAVSAALNAERYRSGLVRKEIVLPDGLHYVYLEGGQGEPLLLLHGFGVNKDNFVRVARYLTPHYRVIIPDHIPHFGGDLQVETAYTIGTLQAMLAGVTAAA